MTKHEARHEELVETFLTIFDSEDSHAAIAAAFTEALYFVGRYEGYEDEGTYETTN